MLPVNDLFVNLRLDPDNQKLLVSNTTFIHFAGMLLQYIVEVSAVEASVEVILFCELFLYSLILLRVFLVIYLLLILLLLGFVLLQPFNLRHSFTIVELFARELNHSAEPFPSEHKLIPEADSLHGIEVVEPELILLIFSKKFAPDLLQVVEHAMELFLSPGSCFNSFELQWVLPIARLSDFVHYTKVEKALFHILFNRALDLRYQECHQVSMGLLRLIFPILLSPLLMILFLFVCLIERALLHIIAVDHVNSLPCKVFLISATVWIGEKHVTLLRAHEENLYLFLRKLILQRG